MSAAEFDPDARAEFLAAVEYYEECQEGLGRRFRLTVGSAADRICEMPFRFRVLRTPFRRCLVPAFPYSVIFSILTLAGALAAAFVVGAEGDSMKNAAQLVTYPAPVEEVASPDFRVTVNGQPVFVYQAKVRQAISKPPDSIWTHELGAPGEIASFAYFDFAGQVTVTVDVMRAFTSAALHPRAAGDLPHGAKSTLSVDRCSNVDIEGIIIRDSSNWAITLNRSENVTVANVKEINGRLNSDGINPVNSRHIRIRDCFIRNHDDSIAVKTTNPDGGEASDILVERCVIWNDWGYGLGITYETRAPIHDVTFRDCDVLTALNWALGIHVVDSATISNIRFENIRVENTRAIFIRLGVTSDMWGKDPNRGHIRGVVFQDVSYTGADTPPSEILGHDAEHKVEDVTLRGLRIGGKAVLDAAAGRFNINAHTSGVRFE